MEYLLPYRKAEGIVSENQHVPFAFSYSPSTCNQSKSGSI